MAWISKNNYLTYAEMQVNATNVTQYFRPLGWSDNAIAAMLGNMQSESNINPGIWENLSPFDPEYGGFGLVQWTPWTNLTRVAVDEWGLAMDDGNGQCRWIAERTASSGQWIPTDSYPMSWDTFIHSADTPENLAAAFLYNFERPADPAATVGYRQEQARDWFNYIGGVGPGPGPDPETPPIWLIAYMGSKNFLKNRGGK